MSQTGFTPILIYGSGTTGHTPSAGNLTSSASGAELALNYTDGILFYKDNNGVVQNLAQLGGNAAQTFSVAPATASNMAVQASQLYSGGKNKICNGNFAINARAVSGTVTLGAGGYGHDRFKGGAGGCTYTFATALNVTTITILAGTLLQIIEGARLFSGAHKLSWVGTATARIDAGGYGASGLAGTAVGGTNQTIEFATGTVAQVQYEPGVVITPFTLASGSPENEFLLCQRYLPSFSSLLGGSGSALASGYIAGTNSNANYVINFLVPARVQPTGIGGTAVTVGTYFTILSSPGGITSTGVAMGGATTTNAYIGVTAGSVIVAGQGSMLLWNTTLGTLYFTGCEL
jgi:hypothetical protein